MQLGFIHARTPGSVDATLNAVVAHLTDRGARVVGVIQDPSGDEDRHRCDMDLIEISSGERQSISQNLGAGSRGCRLDPNAIETVAGRVTAALGGTAVDLLLVNRFGKLEALGRGFAPVIADTLARDIPVLVGVNDLNRAAFDDFSGGLGLELPDDLDRVLAWALGLMRKRAA